jgi:type IV secretion system protein VirB5
LIRPGIIHGRQQQKASSMTHLKQDGTDQGLSPYLAARQEWNERYGSYIAQAHAWRLTALIALVIAVIATGGLVLIASQSQVVPYVVKVDRLGTAIAVDRADRAERPDEAVIVAQLARWVAAVRSVYADATAQRALVKEGYAMINRRGEAFVALNDHMRAHDPFERAKTETVAVEVESVLPISGDSWRLEWREDVRGRDGARLSSSQHQATVTISFNPPRDEATLRINPSGLYINSFHWARRL